MRCGAMLCCAVLCLLITGFGDRMIVLRTLHPCSHVWGLGWLLDAKHCEKFIFWMRLRVGEFEVVLLLLLGLWDGRRVVGC